jgi:hypothetical protein
MSRSAGQPDEMVIRAGIDIPGKLQLCISLKSRAIVAVAKGMSGHRAFDAALGFGSPCPGAAGGRPDVPQLLRQASRMPPHPARLAAMSLFANGVTHFQAWARGCSLSFFARILKSSTRPLQSSRVNSLGSREGCGKTGNWREPRCSQDSRNRRLSILMFLSLA